MKQIQASHGCLHRHIFSVTCSLSNIFSVKHSTAVYTNKGGAYKESIARKILFLLMFLINIYFGDIKFFIIYCISD